MSELQAWHCPGSGLPPTRPLHTEFPRGIGVCAGCGRNYSQNLDGVIIRHYKPGLHPKAKRAQELRA